MPRAQTDARMLIHSLKCSCTHQTNIYFLSSWKRKLIRRFSGHIPFSAYIPLFNFVACSFLVIKNKNQINCVKFDGNGKQVEKRIAE